MGHSILKSDLASSENVSTEQGTQAENLVKGNDWYRTCHRRGKRTARLVFIMGWDADCCCSNPVCAHWVPHGDGPLCLPWPAQSTASGQSRLTVHFSIRTFPTRGFCLPQLGRVSEHAVGICPWTEMVHVVPTAESEAWRKC